MGRKLAVISDIHGNYKALEAFLEYIEENPVDGIVCLGDYVTDAPYPKRTMNIIYEMMRHWDCYFLRGNREDYLLNNVGNPMGWKKSSANGVLLYTLQNLDEQDLEFFRSLPTERELKFEGYPALYLCHGTPGRVRGNVCEEEDLRDRLFDGFPYPYLLGGHSHFQEKIVSGGQTYVNPGSLGLSMNGVGREARFAVLVGTEEPLTQQKENQMEERGEARTENRTEKRGEAWTEAGEKNRKGQQMVDGTWEVELLSIPYDVDSLLRDFTESGVDEIGMTLTKAVKKSLLTGINYFYHCILEMEAEAERRGLSGLSEVPESEWKKLEEKFNLE